MCMVAFQGTNVSRLENFVVRVPTSLSEWRMSTYVTLVSQFAVYTLTYSLRNHWNVLQIIKNHVL